MGLLLAAGSACFKHQILYAFHLLSLTHTHAWPPKRRMRVALCRVALQPQLSWQGFAHKGVFVHVLSYTFASVIAAGKCCQRGRVNKLLQTSQHMHSQWQLLLLDIKALLTLLEPMTASICDSDLSNTSTLHSAHTPCKKLIVPDALLHATIGRKTLTSGTSEHYTVFHRDGTFDTLHLPRQDK